METASINARDVCHFLVFAFAASPPPTSVRIAEGWLLRSTPALNPINQLLCESDGRDRIAPAGVRQPPTPFLPLST